MILAVVRYIDCCRKRQRLERTTEVGGCCPKLGVPRVADVLSPGKLRITAIRWTQIEDHRRSADSIEIPHARQSANVCVVDVPLIDDVSFLVVPLHDELGEPITYKVVRVEQHEIPAASPADLLGQHDLLGTLVIHLLRAIA